MEEHARSVKISRKGICIGRKIIGIGLGFFIELLWLLRVIINL